MGKMTAHKIEELAIQRERARHRALIGYKAFSFALGNLAPSYI
jgi:hypothetical protein